MKTARSTSLILFLCFLFSLQTSLGYSQEPSKRIKAVLKEMGRYHHTLTPEMSDAIAMILKQTDPLKVVELAVPVMVHELDSLYEIHGENPLLSHNEAEGEHQLELLRILVEIADPRSLDTLIKYFPTGPTPMVKALIKIGVPAIDGLIRLLDHESYPVRAMAVYGLGEIGKTKLLPEVNRDRYLKQRLDRELLPALKKAAQDSEPLVRKRAEEALQGLKQR